MKDKHRTTRIGSHELSPRSLMMGYGYDPVRSAEDQPVFTRRNPA